MWQGELEFEKIHDVFRPKILRYLTRLVGPYEAEDLTQEVFVRVNRALRNFRGESQLSTWIYRIATNAALDRLRSPSFQPPPDKQLLTVSIGGPEKGIEERDVWTGEGTPSVEASLIRKEMNDCIRSFIERLPTDNRTILVLSELEGLKNSEIAEILGVSLGVVKVRLHRARAKLRHELETHCSFYRDERNELACDLKSALSEFRKAH
jgi:RNA polymerase sigma-70 factor (ECF subfamily)